MLTAVQTIESPAESLGVHECLTFIKSVSIDVTQARVTVAILAPSEQLISRRRSLHRRQRLHRHHSRGQGSLHLAEPVYQHGDSV